MLPGDFLVSEGVIVSNSAGLDLALQKNASIMKLPGIEIYLNPFWQLPCFKIVRETNLTANRQGYVEPSESRFATYKKSYKTEW